jgi:hypothetical protein
MTPFGTPLDRHHVPDLPEISDHADALASILRRYAKLISEGKSAEDAARELLPIIRIAARYV